MEAQEPSGGPGMLVGVPGGGTGLTLVETWRGVKREAGAIALKGDSPPFPVAKGKQVQGFLFPS